MSCKEVEHRDGKGSEDERDDTEIPFWFWKRIEHVGEDEEERRVKIGRSFFIKFYLPFKIISGVIDGVNLVHQRDF